MPPSDTLTWDQRRFSPALCEVAEAAPSRMLLVLPLVLAGGVLALLVWSMLGHVDMVAQAQGRVLPTARVQLIQPALDAGAGGGVVRAIHVRNGDRVAAGQTLIELDATETRAEQVRLDHRDLTLRVDQAVLQAGLGDVASDPRQRLALPGDTPGDVAAARLEQVSAEWESVRTRLAIADREIERLEASRGATNAQLGRVRQILPLLTERVRTRETLVSQQSMARSQLLELRQELAEKEGEAAVLTQQLRQADIDTNLARERRRQILAERAETLRTRLSEVERSLVELATERARADQRQSRRTLTAPVAGTVADLRVHTIGGVARDGEPILRLVPDGGSLEVEARILNRDVGHVRLGMPVVVKVDSFPFTRYGTLPGRVLDVSADADENPGPGGTVAALNAPVYKARIALERDHLSIDGQPVRLVAGMQVTADIRVGDRRVIDYVLGPMLRLGDEALRER